MPAKFSFPRTFVKHLSLISEDSVIQFFPLRQEWKQITLIHWSSKVVTNVSLICIFPQMPLSCKGYFQRRDIIDTTESIGNMYLHIFPHRNKPTIRFSQNIRKFSRLLGCGLASKHYLHEQHFKFIDKWTSLHCWDPTLWQRMELNILCYFD